MGKVIVRVDPNQKRTFHVGEHTFQYAVKFSENYRIRNPIIGEVLEGSPDIPDGSIIICHHTLFADSPYQIDENIYAIKASKNIFAIIGKDGTPKSVGGNIICKTAMEEAHGFSIPASYQKQYNDRVIIAEELYGLKIGQLVFTYPMAPYEMVYNLNGQDCRIFKIYKDDIVATCHF